MVGGAAGNAGPAPAHSRYDVLIRYIHINCIVNLLSHLLQSLCQALCLRNGPREAVQHITVHAVLLLDSVEEHSDCHLIRNQKSLIHELLRLHTKLCSLLDIRSEDISGGNVRNPVFLGNPLSLCSFSRPWCA